MTVYILILTIILVGIAGHDIREEATDKGWRLLLMALAVLMAVVAGLRYHCGLDTLQYASNYAWANSDAFNRERSLWQILQLRMEYVYHLIGRLGVGVWVVQLSFAVFLNSMFYLLTVKMTRCWFTAFLFYFIFAYFNLNFEVMREGGAAAVGLWAWDNWRRGEYGRYYAKLLLAVFFHLSALFLLLLPLLRLPAMRRLTRKFVGLAAVVAGGLLTGWLLLMAFGLAAGVFMDSYSSGEEGFFFYRVKYYAEAWAHPMLLNWKGYLGLGIAYIAYPALIWYMLGKNADGAGNGMVEKEENADLMAMLLMVIFISAASFEFEILQRFRNYVILFYAVAFARSEIWRGRVMARAGWWVAMMPLLIFGLNTFMAPVPFTDGSRVYNLYMPYGNVIERKEDPCRENLTHEYHENMGEKYGDDIRLE